MQVTRSAAPPTRLLPVVHGRPSGCESCPVHIDDGKAEGIRVSQEQIDRRREEIYKPMEHYKIYRNEIVAGTVNPNYINPRQGLDRLQS